MTSFLEKFSLEGRTALVTGSSRGLGYAIAQGLHLAGAQVLLCSSGETIYAAAEKMGADGGAPVWAARGDIGDAAQAQAVFQQAMDRFGGRLDILVNCAGIQHRCPAEDFPPEQWDAVLNVNLTAAFRMSQLAGRVMLAQGKGRIINVASMTSFFGSERIPAYAASKGGLAQLTKALSNEWTSRGINVNAIAPGWMHTHMTDDLKGNNPALFESVTRRIPQHRWGEPEDLQGLVVFLASDASAYVSGAVIPIDGGYLAY